MADQVAIQVSADVAPAVQEYIKLLQKQSEAVTKVKALDDAHGKMKGPDKVTKGAKEADDSVKGLSSSFTMLKTITAGVFTAIASSLAVARAEWQAWRKEIEEINALAKTNITTRVGAIASAGDTAQAPVINQRLDDLVKRDPILLEAEATGLYGAAREAAPGIDLTKVLDIVDKAAESKALYGGDTGKMNQLADYMARFSVLMPDKSADDLADLANMFLTKTGKYGKRFERSGFGVLEDLKTMGVDPETGAAMALGSITHGKTVTELQPLMDAAKKTIDPKGLPFDLAQESGVFAYNEADEATRLKMILKNRQIRQLTMGDKANEFDAIADYSTTAEELRAAQTGDSFTQAGKDVQKKNIDYMLLIDQMKSEKAEELGETERDRTNALRKMAEQKGYSAQLEDAGYSEAEKSAMLAINSVKQFAGAAGEETRLGGAIKELIDAVNKNTTANLEARQKEAEAARRNPIASALHTAATADYGGMY